MNLTTFDDYFLLFWVFVKSTTLEGLRPAKLLAEAVRFMLFGYRLLSALN